MSAAGKKSFVLHTLGLQKDVLLLHGVISSLLSLHPVSTVLLLEYSNLIYFFNVVQHRVSLLSKYKDPLALGHVHVTSPNFYFISCVDINPSISEPILH